MSEPVDGCEPPEPVLAPFNIAELNRYAAMLQDTSADQQGASDALVAAYERPDFWALSNTIIESPDTHTQLKFLAVNSLRDLISTRWSTLDDPTKDNVRQYVVETIMNWASAADVDPVLMTAMNLALVALLKEEWPEFWPDFLTELMQSAGSSASLCLNNLSIIALLVEECFHFSEEGLTHARLVGLTTAIQAHNGQIYGFLEDVLPDTDSEPLIREGLKVLKYIVPFIKPHLLIESKLFGALCGTFLPQPGLVSSVLGLFSEIFGLRELPESFAVIVPEVFGLLVGAVAALFPDSDDDLWGMMTSNPDFLNVLPTTLSVFVARFGDLLETDALAETMQLALEWMVRLSATDDAETFARCCKFWRSVAGRVYSQKRYRFVTPAMAIYRRFLPEVRRIHIESMERPNEVLIVNDGNIVREEPPDAVRFTLFTTMQQTLAILTAADPAGTCEQMEELITALCREWNPEAYNRLCWSVGAISRVLPRRFERPFVSRFMRHQFALLVVDTHTPYFEIVLSGFIYVVGQYPQFLFRKKKLFVVAVQMLIQSMGLNCPGVKEMAVQAFKTIATSACTERFLNDGPFIIEVIESVTAIIKDLTPDLIIEIFDALSFVIGSNKAVDKKKEQFHNLMANMNEMWSICMSSFDTGKPDIMQEVALILRINAAVVRNVQEMFHTQMTLMFEQMMDVYSHCSAAMIPLVERCEDIDFLEESLRLKSVKSGVLLVLTNYFFHTRNVELPRSQFLPPIMDRIVQEYANSLPGARVSEVLGLLGALIVGTPDLIEEYLLTVWNVVFVTTVSMVTEDYDNNLPFHVPLYEFLMVTIVKHVTLLIERAPQFLDILVDTVAWGTSHPTHDVCIWSLDVMALLFVEMKKLGWYIEFLADYYLPIVKQVFENIVDTTHRSTFGAQNALLRMLLIQQTNLADPGALTEAVADLFPQRDTRELLDYIAQLKECAMREDIRAFRIVMRDFLVTNHKFRPGDPALNQEEMRHDRQIALDEYLSVLSQGNERQDDEE
jgi:exportin-1